MRWIKQTRLIVFSLAFIMALPVVVLAQSSSSTNYQVEEVQFGSGGQVESCSVGQYCAQSSLGSLGVGFAASPNFDLQAGFLTENSPYLEMAVLTPSVDLGELNPSTTGTGFADFYIRTYLSGNYEILTLADPPTNNTAQIDPMGTTAVPTQGTEQFGINLRDNTTPDIGADAVNQPDDSFADGEAAPGYDVPDQFRYVKGEAIARSQATPGNQAVGLTEYRISYVANVSVITEGGVYIMEHELAAVPTF